MKDDSEKIDYLSNLHDTILCHILSFLPTKLAIQTSILSRRWKYLWTQVPALDFTDIITHDVDDMSEEQHTNYMNFVSKILLENNVSYLRRFCCCFNFNLHPNSESWMDAIKWRNICELDMNFYSADPVLLPREFLHGQTLVVLKLGEFYIEDTQNPFYLPNLEILHLVDRVVFPGDQFLKRFIVGCPVLKELVIQEGCGFVDTIYIESLALKSLEIINAYTTSGAGNLCISIKAPNLRCITIFQEEEIVYDFDDVTLLSEAKFCHDGCFPIVTTLQSAKLRAYRTEDKLPTLRNLTHLELMVENWYELLKCAPKLKSLCFREVRWFDKYDFEDVPECMSCLDRAEIFVKIIDDIKLVAYIWKAATTLKEMVIKLHPMRREQERAVYQRLLNLPRSSLFCQVKVVEFSDDDEYPE